MQLSLLKLYCVCIANAIVLKSTMGNLNKYFLQSTGSKVLENGLLFKELLQTPNFRITVVDDADTVELCGALKVNISLVSLLIPWEIY